MNPSWAPDVEEVHSVIPQRANDGFSSTSKPSSSDVESIIGQVIAEVLGEVGKFDPSDEISLPGDDATTLGDLARWTVTLGAAAYIEISFFPEQQQLGDTTPGQILHQRYISSLARLKAAIGSIAAALAGPQRHVTGTIVTPLASVASPSRRIRDSTF